MKSQEEAGRSMAEAMNWVSKITSSCIAMVLPLIFGLWLDKKLGTMPLFSLGLLALGMICGLYLLIKAVTPEKKNEKTKINIKT